MIFVNGIALPDYDKHFSAHILREMDRYDKPGYQTKKWLAALPLVKNRRRAVDVGAHVGLWTRHMAPHFSAGVLAFEPVPDLAECWLANCSSLPAELIRVALGNRTDTVPIKLVTDNSGNAHVAGADVADFARDCISVPMERLDDRALTMIDFMKIDVEGYEAEVIRGAEQTIKRNRPVIVVEQKPHNGSRYGRSDTEAVDILRSWGARVAWEIAGDFALIWD